MLSFSTVGGEEVKKRKEKNHYDLFIFRSALNSLYD